MPGTGGTVNFKYDPFGRRIQKAFTQNGTTTTTNYVYDGKNILETLDSNGNLLARYTQGKGIDEPLAELISGTTSYYERDGLRSVTSLSNSSGALVNTYTYDSYGKLTTSTGSLTNPFQYTGREFDSETTLLLNRARYFDPNAGRFLSQDPIRYGGGVNFYAYTRNNPVVRTDPFGYQDCNAAQWAQSPNACAGPQDPNAPHEGPDGQWYNVPDPTPPLPDPGPTPPPNPPDPNKCDQPPDEPPPPIPPLVPEKLCLAWTAGDVWLEGAAFATGAFGQEEIAIPLGILSLGSHYIACGSLLDIGIGPF